MRKALALGIVAVGAALALVVGTGSAEKRPVPRSADEPASVVASVTVPRAAGPAVTASASAGAGDAEDREPPTTDERFAQRAERVSQAIAMLRYAPGSQPLTTDMRDVLHPNRRHETALPLSFATGTSRAEARPGDLSYELTGNVFTVLPGASLDATLEVFRESSGGSRERIAVDVSEVGLRLVQSGGDRPVTAGLTMTDDGHHVYALRLAPAAIPELAGYRGLARLDVGFTASEGDRQPARASLDFRVAASVPARFTGVSGERLTGEGLEIAVDVDVTERGRYFVQGLLFDANHAPIGFAVARPSLEPGHATVPLLFFGLLFREANASGPYVFETVTGQRLPEGLEADRADMAPWAGPYRTKPYAATDFSDQEYESAAKNAKIQALSDLAARSPAHATRP